MNINLNVFYKIRLIHYATLAIILKQKHASFSTALRQTLLNNNRHVNKQILYQDEVQLIEMFP